MDFGQISATGGFITAVVAVWKVFADGRASRSSGKRLSYSFAIASGGSARTKLALRWFPGFRRWMARSTSAAVAPMELLVFLWNSGNETITREDLFQEKLLRITAGDGRIVSASVDFQSFAAVGTDVRVIRRISSSEWLKGPWGRVDSAVELVFSHLPPGHGAIVRICLEDVRRRVPVLSLIGPVRGLRKITFAGVIVSLPMNDVIRLSRIGRWIGRLVNGSLLGMGVVVVWAAATGVFGHGGFSSRYWLVMVATLAFEFVYLMSRDIRAQLLYRIPSRLAFWDSLLCERGTVS